MGLGYICLRLPGGIPFSVSNSPKLCIPVKWSSECEMVYVEYMTQSKFSIKRDIILSNSLVHIYYTYGACNKHKTPN